MSLPAVPATFAWTQETWGVGLRCMALSPIASHVFTTRQLTLTAADDERRLAESVGAGSVAMATQVHGRHVVSMRRGAEVPAQRPQADAFVSDAPDIAVAVRAADCVPLLMADRVRGVVAAVHAGWRGTAARVAVDAIEALQREFGSNPSELIVVIGPSIGPCCYEVGSELVDAFAEAGHQRYLIDRWFIAAAPRRGSRERPKLRLDVAGANRDQLVLAGVPEDQIHLSELCTAMHLDVLTSYRVEKEQAGRIAGAIRANT